jgi:hypothetical protein
LRKQANLPINYDELIKEVLTTANSIEKNHTKRPSIKTGKVKPAWARTEEENNQQEEREVDELIDFMDQFDARMYVEDIEVKNILSQLHHKIEGKDDGSKSKSSANRRSESQIGYRPEHSSYNPANQTNPFAPETSFTGLESKKTKKTQESSRPLSTNPQKLKSDVR